MTKLFFNYPTCIDHAIINRAGQIVGSSYHPIITVEGQPTADEHVVVDFSGGKKMMKDIIDAHDASGYDHKLWFVKGYSGADYTYSADRVTVKSDKLSIEIPASDFRVIDSQPANLLKTAIAKEMSNDLTRIMRERGLQVTVNVELTHEPFAPRDATVFLFRYVHGLKDSSAYGCKNIAHGHYSFLAITKRSGEYRPDCDDCRFGEEQIERYFAMQDSILYINRKNIVEDSEDHLTIAYNTPRGEMRMRILKPAIPHVILDSETTIEYLSEHIVQDLWSYLLLAKAEEVMISEGLQKGVVIKIPQG